MAGRSLRQSRQSKTKSRSRTNISLADDDKFDEVIEEGEEELMEAASAFNYVFDEVIFRVSFFTLITFVPF